MSRIRLFVLICCIVLLAACNGDDKTATPAPPAANQSTPVPPVITRMVTLALTSTPLPTPTLSYDVVPVAGRWLMFFDLSIFDSNLVHELRYGGAADLLVDLDGSIRGNGYFSANLFDPVCAVQVLDTGTLTYTVTGQTFAEGDVVWADLTLTPDSPEQTENYSVMCTAFGDIRTRSQPILWPILTTLNRLSWSFALESNQTFTFESNLIQDTGAFFDGQLNATVRIERP
jgi:hypothetical protein